MLIYKCRFTAFYFAFLFLISLLITPLSYASMDSDDESSFSAPLPDTHGINEIPVYVEKIRDSGLGSSSSAPTISKKRLRNTLKRPMDTFEFSHGGHYQSAMVSYSSSVDISSKPFNWDSMNVFMEEMDKRAFNTPSSKKDLIVGFVGGVIGCVPSTPATGTLVSSIGDFFNIPIGEGVSTAIVSWTLITTTPCFCVNLADRFYIISNSLFGKEAFLTRSQMEKELSRYQQQKDNIEFKYQQDKNALEDQSDFIILEEHQFEDLLKDQDFLNSIEQKVTSKNQKLKFIILKKKQNFLPEAQQPEIISILVEEDLMPEVMPMEKGPTLKLITLQQNDELQGSLENIISLIEERKRRLNLLNQEEDFETRRVESSPCVMEISTRHKVAIGVLSFASLLDAIINLGVVELAYFKHKQNIFYGTGWAYLLSWWSLYYKTGRPLIDELCCKYQHNTKHSYDQRYRLKESLYKYRQAISRNDRFALDLYNKIYTKIPTIDQDLEKADDKTLFALSCLFLEPASTMSCNSDEETSLLAETRSFNQQVQNDIPFDWKEELLEKLSTILTGAASVGRAVTVEYVLEHLLTDVLTMSGADANKLAWALSIFDLVFRSFAEFDAQQQYMKSWLNTFSLEHLVSCRWVRKILGAPAVINGCLFALSKTVAGINCFEAWHAPLMLQIISLVPSFIQDQAYYGNFFENETNNIISNVASIQKPKTGVSATIARTHLLKMSQKIERHLFKWDNQTIGNLITAVLKSN